MTNNPTVPDPRTAALAEALAVMSGAHPEATNVQRRDVGDYRLGLPTPHVMPTVAEFAAAILAELPPGWCGHYSSNALIREQSTEIARLRAALDGLAEAATTFLANYDAVAESDDPMAAGAHSEEGWWIAGAAALDDALDEAGR